ncbi:Uncharacterised protein [Shigella sonnei]|nr:Uncharacterised protein [Shigella sonnei]
MANIHCHDGQCSNPQTTPGCQHRGNDELARACINDAGEKNAFERRESQTGRIQTERKGHRNITNNNR